MAVCCISCRTSLQGFKNLEVAELKTGFPPRSWTSSEFRERELVNRNVAVRHALGLLVPGMVWLVMMVMVGISPDLYAAAINVNTSLLILSVVSVPSPE